MCLGVFNQRALSGDSNYNFVPKSITTGITDESWLAKIKQSKSKNKCYGIEEAEKEFQDIASRKKKVAFDIDDTLIIPSVATGLDYNTPNYKVVSMLEAFREQGYDIILWSGSGVEWAKHWGDKLGLAPFEVRVKQKSDDIDICVDDCDVDLAKINIKVKRVNNSISRKDWNKNKTI